MIFLDYSGHSKKLQVQPGKWTHGMEHWGRYGSWSMFVLDPMTITKVAEVVDLYAGSGRYYWWEIRQD